MGVTFGTPVVNTMSSRTSFTLAMSGVTTGQPILVMTYGWSVAGASGITDDFATPYTWTKVVQKNTVNSTNTEVWIGTGGAGTSGTLTVARDGAAVTWGGIGTALAGASTAAGAGAIDSSGSSSSASDVTLTPAPLTPSAAGQGALYAWGGAFYNPTDYPDAPWASTDLQTGATKTAGQATYASPTASESLATTWTSAGAGAWNSVSVMVKAEDTTPAPRGTSREVIAVL